MIPSVWLSLALLVASAPAASAAAAEPDWSLTITPDGELFPALDLSQTGHPGSGLVRIRVRAPAASEIHLALDTAGLRTPAVLDAHVAAGAEIDWRPRLDWDLAALRALAAPRQQELRLSLASPGLPTRVEVREVRLHPLDEALYFVRDQGQGVDLGWAFAAYVDPHAVVVDRVLALARAADPGATFTGLAGGQGAVLRQVRALWAALARHGMHYADASPGIASGPRIYSQRVRLPGNAWDVRSANCLDGSVLIASVLERLGIPPFLVLVPRHAFVGFYTDAAHAHAEFLETTLLATVRSDTDAAADFSAALAAGRARWRRAARELDGRHRPDYAVVDIATARAFGIVPLAGADTAPGAGRNDTRAPGRSD